MTDIDRDQLGEWLTAYLDGELSDEEAALVERHLAEDPESRQLLDELERTASLVSSLPRHRAPDSIAEDVRARLERGELLDAGDQAGSIPQGRRASGLGRFAMAAMLGFIVIGAIWVVVEQHQKKGSTPSAVALVDPEDKRAPKTLTKKAFAPREKREESSRSKKRPGGSRGRGPSKGSVASTPQDVDTVAGPVIGKERDVLGEGQPAATSDALLSVLDVRQKLAANVDVELLRDHRFENEQVRLKIRVSSQAEADLLSGRVLAHLAGQDIAGLDGRSSVGSSARFYHTGKPDVNFKGTGQRQILVRASADQLEGLIGDLGVEPDASDDVVLSVAKIPFHGITQARTVMRRLGPAIAQARSSQLGISDKYEALGDAGSQTESAPGGVLTGTGKDLFDDLIKALGLDPDLVSAIAQAEKKEAAGDKESDITVDEVKTPVPVAETRVAAADKHEVLDDVGAGEEAARRPIEQAEGARDKPGTLVERRGKRIEKSRRVAPVPESTARAERSAPVDSRHAKLGEDLPAKDQPAVKPTEQLVTLVVQFIVDETPRRARTVTPSPKPPRPATKDGNGAKPAVKPGSKRKKPDDTKR